MSFIIFLIWFGLALMIMGLAEGVVKRWAHVNTEFPMSLPLPFLVNLILGVISGAVAFGLVALFIQVL